MSERSGPPRLSGECQRALRLAAAVARASGSGQVTPAHLLAALLDDPELAARGPLRDPHAREAARRALDVPAAAAAGAAEGAPPRLGTDVLAVVERARSATAAVGGVEVPVEALVAALAETADPAGRGVGAAAAGGRSPDVSGNTWLRDLRTAARRGEFPDAVPDGRVVARLLRVLGRLERPHPVLVGPADLAPRAFLYGLAHAAIADAPPPALHGAAVLALDAVGLVAASPAPGHLEQRLRTVLREVRERADERPVVRFVEDLGVLLGEDRVHAVLREALAAPRLRLTGVLTPAQARAHVHDSRPLADSVTLVPLDEPSLEEARRYVGHVAARYARHHRVVITSAAVGTAVTLCARYLATRQLPGGALDVLDEAAAAVRSGEARRDQPGEWRVEREHVAAIVSQHTGVPVAGLLTAEADRLLTLESRIAQRVVGQERAVRLVAAAIRRAYAGVADPDRPLGSFLFLGPTGVGKTELARTLAQEVFGDERALVRLDMGEYQEAHAVARLIGAPPGYVGYGQEGELASRLRRQPHAVVLLDEIEKAHPDVFNVLLPVLDEGRLTDGHGRRIDVRSSVIVMTSNLGSRYILDPDLAPAELEARVQAEVRRALRPEFLNRIDEILVFHRLERPHLERILALQLARLALRLRDHRLRLELSDAACAWLIEHGHDPAYGARPLQRLLRREIEDQVARGLLEGSLPGAHARVEVAATGDGLLVIPETGRT